MDLETWAIKMMNRLEHVGKVTASESGALQNCHLSSCSSGTSIGDKGHLQRGSLAKQRESLTYYHCLLLFSLAPSYTSTVKKNKYRISIPLNNFMDLFTMGCMPYTAQLCKGHSWLMCSPKSSGTFFISHEQSLPADMISIGIMENSRMNSAEESCNLM